MKGNFDAMDFLTELVQQLPKVLFAASTYVLLFHGFCEVVQPSKSIHKYGIYPWGFQNRAMEREYVEFFWLTAASNYKPYLFPIVCCATVADGFATAEVLIRNTWAYTDLSVYLCRNLVSTTAAIMFSQRHLSHFAKKGFTFFHRRLSHIFPIIIVYQMCTPGSSRETNYGCQLLITAICPIFIQSWLWTTFQTILVAWVPIIWSYLYVPGRDLAHWSGYSICITLIGPLWGAWLAMERRKRYIRMRRKEDQKLQRHLASSADQRSRDCSLSPAAKVSRLWGKRERSKSPSMGSGRDSAVSRTGMGRGCASGPVSEVIGDGSLPMLAEDHHGAPGQPQHDASVQLKLEQTLAHL